MYTRSAAFYDLIYSWKNYRQEADQLRSVIRAHRPEAKTILDVACGTGEHLRYFPDFARTGIDLDPELLSLAKAKLPDAHFVEADMKGFDLSCQFDVILCLFSAIGYAVTVENLNASISCMARHLNPAGIMLVEPWFTPERWADRRSPGMTTAENGTLKICRIFVGRRSGKISTNTLHYLVADSDNVEYFTEQHDLGLFTEEEMHCAFVKVELSVEFDPIGLTNRGLYLGIKQG